MSLRWRWLSIIRTDEVQKLRFAENPDRVTGGAHLFGLAMLTAGPMIGQNDQILIADNQMGRRLGDRSPNLHTVPGGEIGRVIARQAQAAGENDNRTYQWAIGMRGARLWSGSRKGPCSTGRGNQPIEWLPKMSLGQQHDHRGGASVFACVMVMEIQPQNLFQVAQTMSAVALEFRPCAPGDLDAVGPAEIGGFKAAGQAGCGNGAFVKAAVLDQMMP